MPRLHRNHTRRARGYEDATATPHRALSPPPAASICARPDSSAGAMPMAVHDRPRPPLPADACRCLPKRPANQTVGTVASSWSITLLRSTPLRPKHAMQCGQGAEPGLGILLLLLLLLTYFVLYYCILYGIVHAVLWYCSSQVRIQPQLASRSPSGLGQG